MKIRASRRQISQYFFAYGTLRKGVPKNKNHLLHKYASFIGMGSFQGTLYDIGQYPACSFSSSPQDQVMGELYKIVSPKAFFDRIDRYEEYRIRSRQYQEYFRTLVTITTWNDEAISAWIYLLQKDASRYKKIDCGDYAEYRKKWKYQGI